MAYQTLSRNDGRHLLFSNAYLARPLSMGSNWTQLRIAAWMGISYASTLSAPRLWTIGLCSGTTNLYPNNCHFLGIQSNGTGTWSVQTNYFSGFINTTTGYHRFIQKVGAVETTGSTAACTASGHIYRFTTNNSALYGFEINKLSATSWEVRPFSQTALGSTSVPTRTMVQTAMQLPYGSFAMTNHGYFRDAETLTVDETSNGALDTVNLYWSHATALIDVTGVYVAKLA